MSSYFDIDGLDGIRVKETTGPVVPALMRRVTIRLFF
jgi:hypothetical protein